VQKVPGVLDEVHWLIEHRGLRFILCGSSARKLKRGRAHLLGGRAWRFEMLPPVTAEFPAADGPHARFDILRALNHGLLPSHYLSSLPRRSLEAYVRDYLKEEVFDEGLARSGPIPRRAGMGTTPTAREAAGPRPARGLGRARADL